MRVHDGKSVKRGSYHDVVVATQWVSLPLLAWLGLALVSMQKRLRTSGIEFTKCRNVLAKFIDPARANICLPASHEIKYASGGLDASFFYFHSGIFSILMLVCAPLMASPATCQVKGNAISLSKSTCLGAYDVGFIPSQLRRRGATKKVTWY